MSIFDSIIEGNSRSITRKFARDSARHIDRADSKTHHGSKRKAQEPITDISAPTTVVTEDGDVVVERKPLDALGTVKLLEGRSLGVVVTPSAYNHWIACGAPAHPVFSPEDFREGCYRDNILMPTGSAEICPRCGEHSALGESVCKCTRRQHSKDCLCTVCAWTRANPVQVKVAPSFAVVEPRYAKALSAPSALRFPLKEVSK